MLDRALADMDGCEAVRRFRAQGFNAPVLMLLDQSSGHVRALALRSGVDDLVTKPIDKEELIARIEATVRRRNGHAQSLLRVGPLEIDMATREVRVDGPADQRHPQGILDPRTDGAAQGPRHRQAELLRPPV